MPAIEIAVIEPLTDALSTEAGWIGLLLGLIGREGVRQVRRLLGALRGGTTAE